MCGIVYVNNLKDTKSVNGIIKSLYLAQKSRGSSGFGFVGIKNNKLETLRDTDEDKILKKLDKTSFNEILFHHRLPTSTPNTLNSTHPFVFSTKNKTYHLIHNGIIHNSLDLQQKHKRLYNINYKSIMSTSYKYYDKFCDSESLLVEFALWLNGKKRKMRVNGSVAFICLESDKKTKKPLKLYFYRNEQADLKYFSDKNSIIIVSQGDFEDVEEDKLYWFDYKDKKIYIKKQLHISYTSTYPPITTTTREIDHFGNPIYNYATDTGYDLQAYNPLAINDFLTEKEADRIDYLQAKIRVQQALKMNDYQKKDYDHVDMCSLEIDRLQELINDIDMIAYNRQEKPPID